MRNKLIIKTKFKFSKIDNKKTKNVNNTHFNTIVSKTLQFN